MATTRYWFFVLLLIGGCSKTPEQWSKVAPNPQAWHYLSAESYVLDPPWPNSRIRDTWLELSNAEVLAYQDLDASRSSPVIIAVPITSTSDLITSALRIAGTPQNLGSPFSVILDQRFPVYFLSWTNGAWYSTNILRTSKMAFTVTKEKTEGSE